MQLAFLIFHYFWLLATNYVAFFICRSLSQKNSYEPKGERGGICNLHMKLEYFHEMITIKYIQTFSVVLRTKDQLGVTDSECIQSSNFQFCDNFLLDKNPNHGILTIDSIKKERKIRFINPIILRIYTTFSLIIVLGLEIRTKGSRCTGFSAKILCQSGKLYRNTLYLWVHIKYCSSFAAWAKKERKEGLNRR